MQLRREVYVPHPRVGNRGARRRAEWGRTPTAFVEDAWQGRLVRDYEGGPPAGAAFDLLPAAVSTYGAWHPAFVRWVRRHLRRVSGDPQLLVQLRVCSQERRMPAQLRG